MTHTDFLPSYCLPPNGRTGTAKHKKARQPAWSLKDLADYLNMPQSTIATRARNHPLPEHIALTLKGNGAGASHPCKLYTRQSLINWHLSWKPKNGN